MAAFVLCALLAACGATSDGSDSALARFYAGTWRGYIETDGTAVYGNVEGDEPMLDLVMEADGTAALVPLEGHEDLLSEEGTWEAADESAVTLRFPSCEVELTALDDATFEGPAPSFGIDGFDVLTFRYY